MDRVQVIGREAGVKHVCLVGNLPEPYGGIASLCCTLAKGLLERGVEVSFIDTVVHARKHVPEGMRYMVLDRSWGRAFVGLLRHPRLLLLCARELVRHRGCLRRRSALEAVSVALGVADMARGSPLDLVHVHDCRVRALGSLVGARWRGCPLVVTAHPGEFTSQDRVPCARLSASVAASADVLQTGSAFTANVLSRYGVNRHVDVVPHGVDLTRFRPGLPTAGLRRRFGLEDGERVVLFVGDLHVRKGPDIVIRSLVHLTSGRTRALMVGPDRGMRQELEALACSLHLEDRVVFAGTVPEDLLPSLYNLGEVLAFSTREHTEGFGLVAAEALACGLPVVGSSIAAIPEVVEDGVTGILVPPDDPERLGAALSRLLIDHSLAARMAVAARERAERLFASETMVDHILDLYRRSLAGGGEGLN